MTNFFVISIISCEIGENYSNLFDPRVFICVYDIVEVSPPILISLLSFMFLNVPRYAPISTESLSETSGCFTEDIGRIIEELLRRFILHIALNYVFFVTKDVKCLYLSHTGTLKWMLMHIYTCIYYI